MSHGWEAYIPARARDNGRNKGILNEAMRRAGIVTPTEIRDELEQNQRWWEREYEALKQQCFPAKPFDAAEHEGHDLIDVCTYTDAEARYICATCPEPKDY